MTKYELSIKEKIYRISKLKTQICINQNVIVPLTQTDDLSFPSKLAQELCMNKKVLIYMIYVLYSDRVEKIFK